MRQLITLCLMGFLLCGSTRAQETLILEISKLEKDYAKKEKKVDKQLIDLISIHQLGHRIGKLCDKEAFNAPKGSSTYDVNLRKALLYYSLSAHYAQVAVDKFKSKSMGSQKVKSCEKAAFYYRTLGKPKRIYEKRFIDACGLLKSSDDSKPKDDTASGGTQPSGPEYIDEEFEKTLVGKRLFFKTPKQMFSMMVYEPFMITEEQSTMRSKGLQQFEMAIKRLPKDMQAKQRAEMEEKYNRAHVYNFGEDLGGVIFYAKDLEGKEVEFICDNADSQGNLSYKTKVSGARACISSIYKDPRNGRRLKGGTTLVEVEHKGELYHLMLVVGKNYNSSKHERTLKAMARSLRMEGVTVLPTITETKCKDESVLQLAKGIPVSWTMFDRKRKAVVVQQPVESRDDKIGSSVSHYFGLILEAIRWTKDAQQIMKFSREVIVDRDLRNSLRTAGQWKLEHTSTRMDFVPVEIEDYSNFSFDGSLTTAAIFYLEALQKVSVGISGIAKLINKKSMRLYWEIPTVTIRGECIPQMICENGKWVPDFKNVTYRAIDTTYSKINAGNKDFMSVREVERDLDRYFKNGLNKLERTEARYANAMSRCDPSELRIYDIEFPTEIDKCPKVENNIQLTQYEIITLEQIQKARKEEMTRWLTVLKPAEKKRYETRLSTLRTELSGMRTELKRLIKLYEGHVAAGNRGEAAKVDTQITFMREDISLLESFDTKTQTALNVLISGKRETGMSKELATISKNLSTLKKRMTVLKKEREECVKNYDKIR